MKKIQFFALGAVVIAGSLTSCNNVSSNANLSSHADTISYAVGTQLGESLPAYLVQMGVLKDTSMLTRSLMTETDASKKAKIKAKIDSLVKVNTSAEADFMKGLNSVMNAAKASEAYTKGVAIGSQIEGQMIPGMKSQFFAPDSKQEINKAALLSGLTAALGKQPLLVKDAKEMLDAITKKKQAEMEAKRNEEMEQKFGANKVASQKFLDENKTKAGVVTTASGLQYKVIIKGTGPLVKPTDKIMVNYKGMLTDGSVFDQSKAPIALSPAGMIKGWQEALPMMTIGSKWTLYIPYDLAYGPAGAGQKIPPFSTLVFDVEVVSLAK